MLLDICIAICGAFGVVCVIAAIGSWHINASVFDGFPTVRKERN